MFHRFLQRYGESFQSFELRSNISQTQPIHVCLVVISPCSISGSV